MVLEVSDKSVPTNTCTQYAIRASIPPGPLSAEIQKVQRGWFNAGKATNAQDLYANIPTIHPKTHLIAGLPILAIGCFPSVQAIAEDWPEINDESWYRMAMTVATQNTQAFCNIYALCNQKLGTNAAGPSTYAAKFICSPLQQAPWPVPPPPPPHPPPPLYSVMTQRGAKGFDPDFAIAIRPDQDAIFEC